MKKMKQDAVHLSFLLESKTLTISDVSKIYKIMSVAVFKLLLILLLPISIVL